MKSFSYTPGRLNWGEPNNGSLTMEEGRYITVQRADHPIFQALGKQRGDRIMVLDTVVGKGLMPVAVNFSGTLCLATARTRSIDDYYADGPEETFLHEVPSDMHGGRKYICLPIGLEGSNYLSSQGKKLIDETIKYLLGAQAFHHPTRPGYHRLPHRQLRGSHQRQRKPDPRSGPPER